MARKRKGKVHQELSLFSPRCEQCGEVMVVTESEYLCCPRGHGKLHLDAPPEGEACGSWFAPERGESA